MSEDEPESDNCALEEADVDSHKDDPGESLGEDVTLADTEAVPLSTTLALSLAHLLSLALTVDDMESAATALDVLVRITDGECKAVTIVRSD